MKNLFCLFSLLALFNCSGKEEAHQSKSPDSSQTKVNTGYTDSAEDLSKKSSGKNHPLTRANTWSYEAKVDEEGSTIYKAFVTSPTILDFTFPYTGGSTATLTVRFKNNHTTLYMEVSKGQFTRSFQGGNARIRFDSKPAINYSFSAAENGRANIIFFDAEKKLIDLIKASKKMTVEIEFYAQGSRQIDFKTNDLNWDH